MATRRGGNATVTMAAAGSSLGPTCLSLFSAPSSSSCSPRSSYGPLLFAHGSSHEHRRICKERERGWEREGEGGRWSAHTSARWTSRWMCALSEKASALPFCSFPASTIFFSPFSLATTIAIAMAHTRFIVPDKPRYRLGG